MGEPQGAGARLPGVYFQRGLFFAVACYYFCARRRGRSVARRSSCVARALRGGLWRRRFCQSGRRVARREVVALRGGLWRRDNGFQRLAQRLVAWLVGYVPANGPTVRWGQAPQLAFALPYG